MGSANDSKAPGSLQAARDASPKTATPTLLEPGTVLDHPGAPLVEAYLLAGKIREELEVIRILGLRALREANHGR